MKQRNPIYHSWDFNIQLQLIFAISYMPVIESYILSSKDFFFFLNHCFYLFVFIFDKLFRKTKK